MNRSENRIFNFIIRTCSHYFIIISEKVYVQFSSFYIEPDLHSCIKSVSS